MSADDYNRWRIALYYCYIELPDVHRHVDFQRTACGELHLTGRIRVAPEGINGVLSGEHGRLREYEVALRDELKAIVREDGAAEPFELDVKYCRLREDLPLQDQLFDSLDLALELDLTFGICFLIFSLNCSIFDMAFK